jgi:hypothetical protein
VTTEPEVRLVHVVDDDRNVLKPAIVASRVGGDRASSWSDIFDELEALGAEPQRDDANAGPRHAEEALYLGSGRLHV